MALGGSNYGATDARLGRMSLGGVGIHAIAVSITSNANATVANYFEDIFFGSVTSNAYAASTTAKYVPVSITVNAFALQIPFVKSPRIVSINSQAFATQTFTGLSQQVSVHLISNVNASGTVSGVDLIHVVSVSVGAYATSHAGYLQTVTETITSNANAKSSAGFYQSVSMTLTVNANASATIIPSKTTTKTLSDIQTLTDEFQRSRLLNYTLNDPLTLTESYVLNGRTWHEGLEDIQVLTDVYRAAIVIVQDTIPPHPVVGGVPVLYGNRTTIVSNYGTLILPAFEYGDTFAQKVEMTVKRTMTGKIYTYIRTNTAEKFTLTWVLGLQKALEFKAYFKAQVLKPTEYYTIFFFNGEIWRSKLLSVDIPLSHDGRWLGPDQEKMSISAQFEGTKQL